MRLRIARHYGIVLVGLITVAALAAAGCSMPAAWKGKGKDKDITSWNTAEARKAARERQTDPDGQIDPDRPPTPHTLYSLSKILAAQGKDGQCRQVLARSIQDYPRFLPAYCDLAELHLRNNQVDEARAVLKAGLKVAPDDPVLLNDLGMCSLLSGDYEEALGHFTAAAGVADNDRKYRANMAVALGMMGRDDEALALYRQFLSEEDAQHNLHTIIGARGGGEMISADVAPGTPLESLAAAATN